MKPCMLRTSIQKSALSACDTAAVWFRGIFFFLLIQRDLKKTIQVSVSDPLLILFLVSLTREPVSTSYGVNTFLLGKRSETAIFN